MWTYNPTLPIRNFYGRRVARLLPLHYGTILIAVIFILATSRPLLLLPTIANLALLQAWVPTEDFASHLNPVSWSLSCEAFFYLCFPFIAKMIARWNRVLIAVVIAISLITAAAVVMSFLPTVAVPLLYENPLFRMGGFVLGILLATSMKNGFRSPVPLPLALALCVIAYVIAFKSIPVAMSWGWAPARVYGDLVFLPFALLLIASAATSDLRGTFAWMRVPALVKLGEASFALYLIHYLLLQMFVAAFGTLSGVPGAYLIIGGIGITIIWLSLVVFQYYEKPAESTLRSRLGYPQRVAVSEPEVVTDTRTG
jgi:peptidoglycan/LPS O-acetylase OafA/YrhL